jgi:hypothetical protein
MVGEAIATKLVALGHDVMMGSRTAGNEKAAAWAAKVAPRGRTGTFADAAALGAVIFNCTQGATSLDALRAAGLDSLDGKILVDVANVLPPGTSGGDPLGQRIQAAFPRVKVVKTLNTVNCDVMVDPQRLPGPHTLFVSGNDPEAKRTVRGLVESFGWRDIVDLGDITTTRATESYLALWMSLWNTLGTAAFNIQVVR